MVVQLIYTCGTGPDHFHRLGSLEPDILLVDTSQPSDTHNILHNRMGRMAKANHNFQHDRQPSHANNNDIQHSLG